jgi:hypothetical protein
LGRGHAAGEAVDRVLEAVSEGWCARLPEDDFKIGEDVIADLAARGQGNGGKEKGRQTGKKTAGGAKKQFLLGRGRKGVARSAPGREEVSFSSELSKVAL